MPSYLCELLQTYKPTRTLRSQDSSLLVPRFSLNTYGKRSFTVFGLVTWNSLPVHVRQSQCLVMLKTTTKDVSVHETPVVERKGGGGGGGERERERGPTTNELCIIVLLLVLNGLLLFFYHILFHLERGERVHNKWIMHNCFITSFKCTMFYHILLHLTQKNNAVNIVLIMLLLFVCGYILIV